MDFSFFFLSINPEHRTQLSLSEAGRLYNTAETQLKSSELLYKSVQFIKHHPSKLMSSVRVCLVLGPKDSINYSTPKTPNWI